MSLKDYLANEGISYREKLFDNNETTNTLAIDIEGVKNFLVEKCGYTISTFDSHFDADTGAWNGDLDCYNKSLNTEDLNKFTPLKSVSGNLYLENNFF